MRVLDFIAGAAFVTALLALPFSFYSFHRRPIRSVLIFGIPLLIALGAAHTSQTIAHVQVLETLESINGKYQILINGKAAPDPAEVLLALKALKWLPAHHSDPIKRINVEISDDSQHLVLSVARDSSNPREYWVFYPKYFITRDNEIGRIVTPVFDNEQ